MTQTSAASKDDAHYKSLVMITGASRGIGRAISVALANPAATISVSADDAVSRTFERLLYPIRLVLVARSSEGLDETCKLIEEELRREPSRSTMVTTSCHAIDLANLATMPRSIRQLLASLSLDDSAASSHQYEQCWLVNNAGSLGPLGPAASAVDGGTDAAVSGDDFGMRALQSAIDLNVTSSLWLSAHFIHTFLTSTTNSTAVPTDSTASNTTAPRLRIVNISSLCAIQPFPTMATYCAGKAARDMFHLALAKEFMPAAAAPNSTDSPTNSTTAENPTSQSMRSNMPIKILNYAPGACDTAMTDTLSECHNLDSNLHTFFARSKSEGTLVKAPETAMKLIRLLLRDEYESGAHVDYWDDV